MHTDADTSVAYTLKHYLAHPFLAGACPVLSGIREACLSRTARAPGSADPALPVCDLTGRPIKVPCCCFGGSTGALPANTGNLVGKTGGLADAAISMPLGAGATCCNKATLKHLINLFTWISVSQEVAYTGPFYPQGASGDWWCSASPMQTTSSPVVLPMFLNVAVPSIQLQNMHNIVVLNHDGSHGTIFPSCKSCHAWNCNPYEPHNHVIHQLSIWPDKPGQPIEMWWLRHNISNLFYRASPQIADIWAVNKRPTWFRGQ
jgi:hypothetical protein